MEYVGQYTHLPGQPIGLAITATGVTPDIVLDAFFMYINYRLSANSHLLASVSHGIYAEKD